MVIFYKNFLIKAFFQYLGTNLTYTFQNLSINEPVFIKCYTPYISGGYNLPYSFFI